MASLTVIIKDQKGLHAKAASIVVNKASKFISDIIITCGTRSGDLKSIMNLMSLSIRYGAEITITASGKDENDAIAELKTTMQKINLI